MEIKNRLPGGWKEEFDERHNRVYYYHEGWSLLKILNCLETKRTQWHIPTEEDIKVADSETQLMIKELKPMTAKAAKELLSNKDELFLTDEDEDIYKSECG
jgi:hypothetical protein